MIRSLACLLLLLVLPAAARAEETKVAMMDSLDLRLVSNDLDVPTVALEVSRVDGWCTNCFDALY